MGRRKEEGKKKSMYNRKDLKYINESDLYFSELRGNKVYCWNRGNDIDPTDVSGSRKCPVFLDVNTNEEFLVKTIRRSEKEKQYQRAVFQPTGVENVFWPVDLLKISDTAVQAPWMESAFGIAEDEEYTGQEEWMIALFPCRNYGVSKTVQDELSQFHKINWREQRIRSLILRILEGFQKLNEQGCLCLDLDFAHLYLRDDGSIFFSYSDLLIAQNKAQRWGREGTLKKGEYPVEFAEPALVQGQYIPADLRMQNYGLAAMLFYLMIGRYPYDGPLMAGITDTNEIEHIHKFEVYHKNPVFIFDEQDTSNHLGEFAADGRVMELWEELPATVRILFQKALGKTSALRTVPDQNASPKEWLDCLKSEGWK